MWCAPGRGDLRFGGDLSHILPPSRRLRHSLGQWGPRLTSAARRRPARAVFLNDSSQCAQGLVRLARRWERGGHIGFQHDYGASRGVPRCVVVASGATEIIFGENLVGAAPVGGLPFFEWSLHGYVPSATACSGLCASVRPPVAGARSYREAISLIVEILPA